MQVKAIVFDLEGTLFESAALNRRHLAMVIDVIARRHNFLKEEANESLLSKRKRMKTELGYVPPLTNVLQGLGLSKNEFFATIEKIDPIPFIKQDANLKRMLQELRNKDLKLVLLTNVGHRYALRILEALGINTTYFDYLITGSEMEEVKPHPYSFRTVVEYLNLPPDQIIMVGDRIAIDLAPAKALGMKTVLVTEKLSGLNKRNKNVDVVLKRIYDLPDLLKNEGISP